MPITDKTEKNTRFVTATEASEEEIEEYLTHLASMMFKADVLEKDICLSIDHCNLKRLPLVEIKAVSENIPIFNRLDITNSTVGNICIKLRSKKVVPLIRLSASTVNSLVIAVQGYDVEPSLKLSYSTLNELRCINDTKVDIRECEAFPVQTIDSITGNRRWSDYGTGAKFNRVKGHPLLNILLYQQTLQVTEVNALKLVEGMSVFRAKLHLIQSGVKDAKFDVRYRKI